MRASAGSTQPPSTMDLGANTEIRYLLTQRITLTGRASWHDRKYRVHDLLDGPVLDLSLGGTWVITPTLRAEVASGYAEERAVGEKWRHDTRWAKIGASVALPYGLTFGGSGEYRNTKFEGNWFPFTTDGSAREDHTRIFRASIYHRGFTFYGFSPQLAITSEERKTNAQTYDYKDTNGELRFVRQF